MSRFFISRPIFATVIALIMLLAGVATMFTLPIAQFPTIVPPTVQVSAIYNGADAETVAQAVTSPLEQQINGVQGMLYMSSNSTSTGQSIITCTFEVGYDLNIAAVDVQNRAQQAFSQLPQEVQQLGVTVTKQSSNMTMVVALRSPDGDYDSRYLTNLADITVAPLLREEDLELEREVVLEEIAEVEDTPDDLVFELHGSNLWPDSAYGRSILGSAESVASMPIQALREVHGRAYRGGNLTVAAAGNIWTPKRMSP